MSSELRSWHNQLRPRLASELFAILDVPVNSDDLHPHLGAPGRHKQLLREGVKTLQIPLRKSLIDHCFRLASRPDPAR